MKFDKKMTEAPLCKCGCGGYVTWNKQKRRWRRWKSGHNDKTANCKTKEKFKRQLCLCGCGEYAGPGDRYLPHHYGKSEDNRSRLKNQVGPLSPLFGFKQSEKFKKDRSDYMLTDKNPMRGKYGSDSPVSIPMKEKWKDPEYVKKIQKSLNLKPNKPETIILNILEEMYPGRWKYTGDFSFMIDGKSPDFINEEKKLIIEHFGDHWHKGENPQDRIDVFKPFGWDTLIIWEKELKDACQVCIKIDRFVNLNHIFERREK